MNSQLTLRALERGDLRFIHKGYNINLLQNEWVEPIR
ncbi:spermidine N1-acetyltransferase [Vibrio cholerae]|nr:spermidine N1-acetyltransferase [Vibrio cholerae]CSC43509.1 spermidine N1-acetyltransferase [Vibrio cholerae]